MNQPRTRKTLRRTIRTRLRTSFGQQSPCRATHYVRQGYRRFLSATAPRVGGVAFRLWGWWYYYGGGLL